MILIRRFCVIVIGMLFLLPFCEAADRALIRAPIDSKTAQQFHVRSAGLRLQKRILSNIQREQGRAGCVTSQ